MDYSKLAELYEQLESTSKRLEKTRMLAQFLRKASDLDRIMLLVQGKVFASWDPRELGIASRLAIKAIATATGMSQDKVESEWKKSGDLGLVAEEFVKKKKQATLAQTTLTVKKVFDNLQKLAELEGAGTVDKKVQAVAELLTSAEPLEARYIIRTVIGDLRIGIGDGTLRDAIVGAFFADDAGVKIDKEEFVVENREKYNKVTALVQHAIDVANDFGSVAVLAKEKGLKGLEDVELVPGTPVKVMLFQKAKDIEDALKTVGTPAAVECKYDGFRLQIHKTKKEILLFTRRLENVTKQFPDIVKRIKEQTKGDTFILDAEAVGIDPKTFRHLPFQQISQRIKRKYDIEEMAKKFPVEVNVFDILYYDGESLLKKTLKERRKVLEHGLNEKKHEIRCSEQKIVKEEEEAEKFYKHALALGYEGIMVKNLESIYKPGSRVGFGMKVKPTMETLDVVITGAEWGEGKRGKWLASFIIAIRDEESGEYMEIGRVGTGFKEKEEEGVSFEQMTQLLKPLVTEESGREVKVKPKIVIEVDYEEIQASPTYSSGFALRFPRFVRLRDDRKASDCTTTEDVTDLYRSQRGRAH